MTVTTGRELFQGVVSKAGVFPSSDSPAYKTFQYWTGLEVVPRNGSDAIQKYFRPAFNEKKISEIEIDDMFRNFALAAMKQHLSYLFIDAFRGAYGLFTSHPYLECLRAGLGFSDSTCPDNPVLACRFQWFCTVGGCSDAQVGAMCQPVVKNAFMTSVWANLMSLYEGYYPSVMIGVLLLTVVGGITGFVRRSVSLMVVAFHFALLMGIQGMFSAVEGRYTMIVYPFIAILATYGARTIIDGVRRKLLIRR
jgi:hypothetical protein